MDTVPKEQNKIDYFKWYSDEITRYRDYEWKAVTYSISMSWTVVVVWLLKDIAYKEDLRCIVAGALSYFVFLLLLASLHIHHRLNVFRWRRTEFEAGHDRHKKVPPEFNRLSMIWAQCGIDWFYILFFIASPLSMWSIALIVIYK